MGTGRFRVQTPGRPVPATHLSIPTRRSSLVRFGHNSLGCRDEASGQRRRRIGRHARRSVRHAAERPERRRRRELVSWPVEVTIWTRCPVVRPWNFLNFISKFFSSTFTLVICLLWINSSGICRNRTIHPKNSPRKCVQNWVSFFTYTFVVVVVVIVLFPPKRYSLIRRFFIVLLEGTPKDQ